MRTKLVAVGNSKGIRLPKALLEAARLRDEVVLSVLDGRLIITRARPRRKPRAGWAEAIAADTKRRGVPKLDPGGEGILSSWDAEEWRW